MAGLDFIPTHSKPKYSFAVEPAHNALCSLRLLSLDIVDHLDWFQTTRDALSAGQIKTLQEICGPAASFLEGVSWSSFPDWIDHIAARDPDEMARRDMDYILSKVRIFTGQTDELPTPEDMLRDRDAYISVVQGLKKTMVWPVDLAEIETEYQIISNPEARAARKQTIIETMRMVWERHLRAEWDKQLPALEESVRAFESVDYARMSAAEAFSFITQIDKIPAVWENWILNHDEIVFIPSPHIGHYVLMMDVTETRAFIVVQSRRPEGATVPSPALNRSELQMRLSALSDDTRLRILELLSLEGERNAKEIQHRLDLSQSAASRHLNQLAASGYLDITKKEGAKTYRLNRDRIAATFTALNDYLK